jgi:acrylyl-CoA reductase (NADPH)
MARESFRCYLVAKDAEGRFEAGPAQRVLSDLPEGNLLVQVAFSSLNYKDALSATGHPGVTRVFPHVPGVDAIGTVVQSGSPRFAPGDGVLVSGFGTGENRWGGFAEYVRVPAEWAIPAPAGLSPRDSMIYGTAGFTAALCVEAIQARGIAPAAGEIVVTGATGGVGSIAVAILAKLGYRVVAATGKAAAKQYLANLGACRVVSREELDDRSGRPLLSAHWAGAVDTVGGNILATVLRSTCHQGCVAACGMAAGSDLAITVYPFILRGVQLTGIDASRVPIEKRIQVWEKLAGPWRIDALESIATIVDLDHLGQSIGRMLAGGAMGRVVVRPGNV